MAERERVEHPIGQKILQMLDQRSDIPWPVQDLMREAQVALGGYWRGNTYEDERALIVELLRALRAVKTVHEGYVWGLGHGGGGGHFALPEEVDIAIAKTKARVHHINGDPTDNRPENLRFVRR